MHKTFSPLKAINFGFKTVFSSQFFTIFWLYAALVGTMLAATSVAALLEFGLFLLFPLSAPLIVQGAGLNPAALPGLIVRIFPFAVLLILLSMWLGAGLMRALLDFVDGKPVSIKTLYSQSFIYGKFLRTAAWVIFIYGACIAGPAIIIGLIMKSGVQFSEFQGMMLGLAKPLFSALVYGLSIFAFYTVVDKKIGGLSAIEKNFSLMKGSFIRVCALSLLLFALSGVVSFIQPIVSVMIPNSGVRAFVNLMFYSWTFVMMLVHSLSYVYAYRELSPR